MDGVKIKQNLQRLKLGDHDAVCDRQHAYLQSGMIIQSLLAEMPRGFRHRWHELLKANRNNQLQTASTNNAVGEAYRAARRMSAQHPCIAIGVHSVGPFNEDVRCREIAQRLLHRRLRLHELATNDPDDWRLFLGRRLTQPSINHLARYKLLPLRTTA